METLYNWAVELSDGQRSVVESVVVFVTMGTIAAASGDMLLPLVIIPYGVWSYIDGTTRNRKRLMAALEKLEREMEQWKDRHE